MYLIKAGGIDKNDTEPFEVKGRSQDFERAKHKANKLLKFFAQVEIIDAETKQCVHFVTRGVK
jgi:hypothetical protein